MAHAPFPEPTTNLGDTPASQTPPESPIPAASAKPETAGATPTFRVGDYEVGNGYFSDLSGHPDIIY